MELDLDYKCHGIVSCRVVSLLFTVGAIILNIVGKSLVSTVFLGVVVISLIVDSILLCKIFSGNDSCK